MSGSNLKTWIKKTVKQLQNSMSIIIIIMIIIIVIINKNFKQSQ
jgi:hypothetical protein